MGVSGTKLTNNISRTAILAKVVLLLVERSRQPNEEFRTALQSSHLVSGTRLKPGRKLLWGQFSQSNLVDLRPVRRVSGKQPLRLVSHPYGFMTRLSPLTDLNISKLATAMPSDLR